LSKFHSTVSRRDFMKGLGLAGAGLGAAAATAPVFHDLDEVTSIQGETKHPWYVKELELEKPTVEMDWSVYQRVERTRQISGTRWPLTATSSSHAKINDTIAAARVLKDSGHNINWMKEKFPSYEGPDLRTTAMLGASATSRMNYGSFEGVVDDVRRNPGEPLNIPTPDVKSQGTPEENLKTLRNAARFFGAAEIGVVPLTANMKKLFNANYRDGTPVNFVSGNEPYRNDNEIGIPSGHSVLFFSTLESSQARQAPGPTWTGYEHYSHVERKIHYFLGAMGYKHSNVTSYTQSVPFGVFSGVVEHSRACMIATSYKYGNMFRGMHRITTDFPLAPTNPIDAGINTFCKTCKVCAESCPYDAMPLGDPRWDHEEAEEETLKNYIPGFKGYRLFNLKCIRCKNCHTVCPFNSPDTAIVHDFVRATAATVPIFNGFMANMHRVFGYGTKNPDEWWEHDAPIGLFDAEFVKP